MMEIQTIEIITNTILILLILVLVYIAAKKPKEFFINYPLEVLKMLFKWHLIENLIAIKQADIDVADFEYNCERKIIIDFKQAEKYFIAFSSDIMKIKQVISDGIISIKLSEFSEIRYFKSENSYIIVLPKYITF